jgi:hypothetical protein
MSFSDILYSDHLPIVFHILHHVTTNRLSEPLEKFTDWERFQNLAANLILPRVEINSVVEADKAALDLTASIASAYRLSTSKVKLPELYSHIPGLVRQLKHKKRLRKLWQETMDPMCKQAFNWISKTIRRVTRKRAPERWESKIANSEVTPQAIWPIAELLTNWVGPTAPTAIHGPLGIKFHPLEKANAIAGCLEKQFTPYDLCEENHKQ